MSLLNILIFSIETCAFVAVVAGVFWICERLFGKANASVHPR